MREFFRNIGRNRNFRMRSILVGVAIFVVISRIGTAHAQELSTRNQFSASLFAFGSEALPDAELGFLWQPDISWYHPFSAKLRMGAELSAQTHVKRTWDSDHESLKISGEAYRYVLKLDTPQSEIRVGLQRLNFGAAQMLRPLKWFDNLKPQDTLEQTSGVKAILARHYFSNNLNIWAWGILGDDEIRGNEAFAADKDKPQWGGRLQIPNPLGETACSFHTREVAASELNREYRIGFDHRLDTVVGAWLEASGSTYEAMNGDKYYSGAVTVGADYTFGIGNGLAVTLENQALAMLNDEPGKLHNDLPQTALMLSYPLGLLDELFAMGTWSWDAGQGLVSFVWRRTYDYFSYELVATLDSGMPATLSRSPSLTLCISYNL